MSITFETFTFLSPPFGNQGNVVIAKPAGTVQGDLLVWLGKDDRSGPRVWTLPAGWALIDTFVPGGGQTQAGAAAFLVAGPSEPSTYIFQILAAANSGTVSAILRFSATFGFPVAPIGAFARLGINTFQISPVDYTIPSANVVATKARILRALLQGGAGALYGDGTFNYQSGPAATELMDKGTGDGNNRAGIAAYLEDVAVGAGATGISLIRFTPAVSTTTYLGHAWTLPLLETPAPPVAVVLTYEGDPASTDLSATAQLLTGLTDVEETVWFQAWSFRNLSFQIEGMNAGDKVDLRGVSKVTQPLQTEIGFQIQNMTTNGEYLVQTPPKWIKLRRSTVGAVPGAVSAFLFGAARNQ